jgi:hypothetical protein
MDVMSHWGHDDPLGMQLIIVMTIRNVMDYWGCDDSWLQTRVYSKITWLFDLTVLATVQIVAMFPFVLFRKI